MEFRSDEKKTITVYTIISMSIEDDKLLTDYHHSVVPIVVVKEVELLP